jgi:hypothetical protein
MMVFGDEVKFRRELAGKTFRSRPNTLAAPHTPRCT